MLKIIYTILLILPGLCSGQIILKAGGSAANRWDERLNGQTIGKGVLLSLEKKLAPSVSFGTVFTHTAFSPNQLVKIRFTTISMQITWYMNKRLLQPYAGLAVGFNKYYDETNIDLGSGTFNTQVRKKIYGLIAPFAGLHYAIGKAGKTGVFLQLNADFTPLPNIAPIGFLATTLGLTYSLPSGTNHHHNN